MICDHMDSAEARTVDAALNHPSGLSCPIRLTRLARGLAAVATAAVLFYAVVGYLGRTDMFADHPRTRVLSDPTTIRPTSLCREALDRC